MTTNRIKLNCQKHLFFSIKKDTLLYSILSILVFIIIILLVLNPAQYSKSTLEGLNLYVLCVLPGLFPFMFFTKLLTSFGMVKKISTKLSPVTRVLFNTNGVSAYVFIMSILSGYPIGAKLISDLYVGGSINQTDAKKMVSFCTTSGPIFIIGTVGAIMFGSALIGLIIYLSHIISSVMCGIILSGKRIKPSKTKLINLTTNLQNKQNMRQNNSTSTANKSVSSTKTTMPDNILSSTMQNTVESILIVGAYITIFFLLADILTNIGFLNTISSVIDKLCALIGINPIGTGLSSGILEVTRGCKVLSQNLNITSICAACAIISFSGISIIMQSINFLSKCKIKARYFILVKCVHAILSVIVCIVLCKVFAVI